MRRLRNILLITTALMPITPVFAGPNGGVVVNGSAQINNPGSANVTINQFSDKAVINWNLFNIGVGEKTTFVQPNSNSIALNRVVGNQGPSQILGSLDANGKVFVINRDGFLFGAGAVINTAGFLATTSDIKNEDFMAGRFNFQIPGRPNASIVNMGTITATSGGFAALVAPGVRNSGTITATLGTVTLASGNTFSLDFYGDRLVQLGVGDQIASEVKDVATGQTLKSLVTNEGRLKANGGRVELTAVAARQVVDSVINTSGVIEANSVGVRNGQIVLGAATSATKGDAPAQKVHVSGKLSAAGRRAGTKGGSIIITGEHIDVAGATINASGRDGGGKVLIGGDWGGSKPDKSLVSNQSAKLEDKPIPTATTVNVDAATRIDASAKDKGDGGKVVLWSDQTTTFAGTILALGGAQFGNGGLVETSSKGQLNFTGNVDTRAPNGTAGTLLLDPHNIDVITTGADSGFSPGSATANADNSQITVATLQNLLLNGNVVLNTGTTGTQTGDITFQINTVLNWSGANSLTVSAAHDITFLQSSGITNTGSGNLVLRADNAGAGSGKVNFNSALGIDYHNSTGKVSIYYSPDPFTFKYGNPINYAPDVTTNPGVPGQLTSYMLVNSASDLQAIGFSATTLSQTYALGKDINASGFSGYAAGSSFSGVFDGNGGIGSNYAISNLGVTLFPFIGTAGSQSGAVRNLTILNANILAPASQQDVGILVGQNNGIISNVSVSGAVNGSQVTSPLEIGGIAGLNNHFGVISGSQSSATVVGAPGSAFFVNRTGGLAGNNNGTINNSTSSGNISGAAFNVVGGVAGLNINSASISGSSATSTLTAVGSNVTLGGLVGQNDGTISNATTNGAINGGSFSGITAGGLLGQNNNGATVTSSQSAATVTIGNGVTGPSGFNYAGGLVGINGGTINGNSSASGNVTGGTNAFVGGLIGQNNSAITGLSASGNVSGGSATGGLVGFNANGVSITNSSATGNVTGTSATAMVGGLVGQNEGTIVSSTHNTGTISGNGSGTQNIILGGLVGTNNAAGSVQSSTVTNTSINGLIATAGGLVGVNSGHVAGSTPGTPLATTTITLNGNNSVAGGLVGSNSASGVIQIAGAAGTLNRAVGASSSLQMAFGGLVGLNGGSIDTTTASTTVNGGAGSSGGLVAQNDGSIASSSASGNVSGTGASNTNIVLLGGLIGNNHSSAVTNSTATGTVSTGGFANIGGLIGFNSGNLSNLSAANTITTSGNWVTAGGLIGTNSGTLQNMSASNAVSASGNQAVIGGLVGFNNGGTITNGRATGNVTSTFNATTFSDQTSAGGLVGSNAGTINGTSQPNANTACAAGVSCATGNVSVGSHGSAGGLVGFGQGGSITNSFATGTVTGAQGFNDDNGVTSLGGLVGLASGTISGSHARGAVGSNVAFLMAGGLVGDNGATITNSFASGNVTAGNNSQAGGLVGGTSANCLGCSGNISNSTASGNVTVGATSVAGGFAGGVHENTALTNTSATGVVTGGHDSVIGGLVGALGMSTITNGQASGGNVLGTGANVMAGGLVGVSFGTISNSTASKTVTVGTDSYAGGLVGTTVGRVDANSSASGAVNGGNNSVLGGLAGLNGGTITQSTASGAVTTGNFGAAGGLVGANVVFQGLPPGPGLPGSSFPNGTIVSSSSSGVVTGGTSSKVGGLIGINGGSISGLTSSATVSGGDGSIVGGLVGVNGGPSGGPAFPAVITGCSDCPLGSASVSSAGGTIANSSASGQVSGGSLSTIGGLVGSNPGTITGSQSSVALNVPNAFVLGGLVGLNDSGGSIVNSSATGAVSGSTFVIGGLVGSNAGSISGSNASGNVTGGPDTSIGGFAGFNTGTISNSNASGNVSGGPGGTFGGLVAFNEGTITNSFATGAVNIDPGIGAGLVAVNLGTITGSHSSGAVTGDDGSLVGGLVGYNLGGSIANSFSVSNVTTGADGVAGGLAAINFGSISRSFATGKVTAGDNSYAGGLVGFNFGDPTNSSQTPIGVISQSYATGAVTGGNNSVVGGLVGENAGSLDQTYAAGRVIGGTGSITGGLVASNNFALPGSDPSFPSGITGTNGTATNSYWDTQTTGQSTSAGGTGLTSAQLTNTLPGGFDPSAWNSKTDPPTYPFLAGQPNPLPVPGDPAPSPPVTNPPVTNPVTPPVTIPPVTIPQQPQNPQPDTTTSIVLLSPQTNIGAALGNTPGPDTKKSELVINNQSGPSGQGGKQGQGSGSPSGQKGNAAGNAGRPPANVVAAFGLGPLPSGMPPLNETRFRDDEIALQLGLRLSDQELKAMLAALNLEVLYEEDIALLGRKVLRLKLPAGGTVRGTIAALEAKGARFSAQPAYQHFLVQDVAQAPSPADTNRKGDSAQYVVEKLGLPEAHLIATGKDVKVAVIDSEIDQKHPDLEGAVTGNFDALPSDDQTAHPHGTGMAGAIASHRRLLGVAPGAKLLAVRAFGVNTGGAQGTSMNIVKGLQWAVDQGAKVINMSFAGPKDPILQQAMQRLTDQGIILIAAAGNAGPKSPPLFPGADPNVIAVSATDVDNKTYKNANRGKYVAIASPGVDILVPAPEGGYQLTTGTSVAAAHISGVVALMLERNKDLKPAEVRSILTATAKNIGGVKTDVGAGLVDPAAALAKAGPKSARLN